MSKQGVVIHYDKANMIIFVHIGSYTIRCFASEQWVETHCWWSSTAICCTVETHCWWSFLLVGR